MLSYSLGFAFDEMRNYVLLIRKGRTKAAWQAGRLNGIGGKVEAGETASESIVREFREETGVSTYTSQWIQFGKLLLPAVSVYCFVTTLPAGNYEGAISSPKDEEVDAYPVSGLYLDPTPKVSNLMWLIHMGLAVYNEPAGSNHVTIYSAE